MVGQLIDDRYEIGEVIASGGMATVWRARDIRLDREVAIKRPHPTTPDDPTSTRIINEAKLAASISHPNLVSVFDVGEDEQGLYLVMELVDGQTLDQIAPMLSRDELIDVGVAIGEALAEVHAAGIVHRDVKPANILMAPSGPQLTDFGIALDQTATSRLTVPGVVFGTPDYTAPEVLAGETPTPKSDVYSLAVLIQQLVTGGVQSTATAAESAGPTPTPLEPLSEVFERALSHDPEVRPDAGEFAAGLRGNAPTRVMAATTGDTIPMAAAPPPPPPPGEHVDRARSRNGIVWLIGAAVALLAIFAIANGLTSETPAAASETTTSTTETVLSSTTSLVTTSTSTSNSEPVDPVVEARNSLVGYLESIPPPDLKPKDLREIVDRIDELILEATAGESDKAEKKLREIADRIEKDLQDDHQDAAMAALENLATVIGLATEESEEDD